MPAYRLTLFSTLALVAACANGATTPAPIPATAPASQAAAAAQSASMAAKSAAQAAAAEATAPSDAEIIAACRTLVEGYAIARDQVNAEAFGALFKDDAEFVFGKNRVQGTAAIVALMQERARNTLTRHLMTTTHITPVDASNAKGLSYFVVFSEAPAPKEDRPIPSAGPRAVIEYHDQFERIGDAWKIKRREVKLVYVLRDR